jgi:hypothetical protein
LLKLLAPRDAQFAFSQELPFHLPAAMVADLVTLAFV